MELSLALTITNPLCAAIMMMIMILDWENIQIEWENLNANWEDLGP